MAKKKTPEAEKEPASAEYTVLARRYRPQQFADLVGQEPVAQALMNAVKTNRVAHGYLFTGARGVGKTSTARILAKALNCERGPTTTPCDQCDLCKAIAVGEDMDVLEIDGASNRGIDEVREIRQNVQFRPSRARYKIYIIDEVHMLTPPAFNALLKTLEEPPAHVKFIFATTEVQKIPITILSRCQRFDFAGIGLAGIVERLKSIVANEGMQADAEALDIIARRAGGSMRDAQSLLDQLLAFGGDKLTSQQVHRLLGTANEERVAGLVKAVLARDAKGALEFLSQEIEHGLQLGELLDQLIEYWRDLMVVNCAGLENQSLSVGSELKPMLKEQAEHLSADTIMAGIDVLVGAKNKMRFSGHARVLFEMALVRLCQLENLVPLSQLAQWVHQGGAEAGVRPKSASNQSLPRNQSSGSAPPLEKKKLDEPAQPPAIRPLQAEFLQEIWQQVISQAGLMLSRELGKAINVAIFGPNTLVVRFPLGYNRQGEQYLDSSRLAKVEEILSKIVGQPCSLRMEIAEAEAGNVEPGTQAAAPVPAAPRARKAKAEIAQIPLVGKAIDTLSSQIVHMDEDFGTQTASDAVPEPGASTEEG